MELKNTQQRLHNREKKSNEEFKKLEEYCKDGIEGYEATLEVELRKLDDTHRCKNENLTNRVESLNKKSKQDFDTLKNKLKNNYMPKLKTNELVSSTVSQLSNQLHSRI